MRAKTLSQEQAAPLRVHLHLDPQHEPLHRLPWELLQDPLEFGVICRNENVLFSRYLPGGATAPPVPAVSRADLRALVAVANPTDLGDYDLAPIHGAEEVRRTCNALGAGLPREQITVLAPEAGGPRATLNAIAAALRDRYSFFYLVCHGKLYQNTPYLFLEQEDGSAHLVDGNTLVQFLCERSHRPALIVLASCQSASASQSTGTLAAFGPRLVSQAGIAAVVAMQGNVPVQTIEQIMPVFFRELHRDGVVDRAMAAARASMGISSQWWVPVLFLRTQDGRLWPEPDPASCSDADEKATEKTTEQEKRERMKRPMKKGTKGIPADLFQPLRETLLDCGPFASDRDIWEVFSHERLRPWRNRLPQASSYEARVDAIIAFLAEQWRSDTGENVLVLLLRVLSEKVDRADACHDRLEEMADALEAAWSENPLPPPRPPEYQLDMIHELILRGFSAEDVDQLCFYHFREVHDQFVPAMANPDRITRWIRYCSDQNRIPELLSLLRTRNPKKYAEYEHRLTR
ncbi:MAG: CHAT domain-containing protein [Chloroflexaceae bacterium]|nr:CHAT domain-containing protein [Chloroflexaceae bacterium]